MFLMFYGMNYKNEEFKKLLGVLPANTSFSLLKFQPREKIIFIF